MSIRSLADSRGQSVAIQSSVPTYDAVNSPTYTHGSSRSVTAYVADNGAAWEQERGRPASPRSITVYIPGNDAVDGQDIIVIDSVTYTVSNVKHPGMKTRGALAYTIVEAVSNPGE